LDGAYAYDSEVRLAIKIKNRERKFLNRSMEIALYFQVILFCFALVRLIV